MIHSILINFNLPLVFTSLIIILSAYTGFAIRIRLLNQKGRKKTYWFGMALLLAGLSSKRL